jgi:hypothetical protein
MTNLCFGLSSLSGLTLPFYTISYLQLTPHLILQREVERVLEVLEQCAFEIDKKLMLPTASLRTGVVYVLE